MKYFRWIDDDINVGRITYNEFDEEYYCLRAIFEENDKLFTTNFVTNEYRLPGGSYLDMLDNLGEEITENEFNNKWEIALKPFMKKWNETKHKNDIGDNIKVRICCIYPQGVIFRFDEIFHGIADYDECISKYGWEKLYPNIELEIKIIGYDENNMWIKLKPN